MLDTPTAVPPAGQGGRFAQRARGVGSAPYIFPGSLSWL